MKHMNKIALVLALCASTQAFGWLIRFDSNALNKNYDILTFERMSDYEGMLKQASAGKKINQAALKIAPLVGKASATAAVIVPDPEFKAAMLGVKTASDILVKILGTGVVQATFGKLTKEGYTVDYISGFTPTSANNYKCKGASQLKKHTIHPIKGNQNIFYVIYDKGTGEVLYSEYGPAYGWFNFTLGELKNKETGEKHVFGNLKLIDRAEGGGCPKKSTTFKGYSIHRQ